MPKSYYKEIGSTGLNALGGFVTEEFLIQLAGDRAVRIYKEMASNDPIVGAVLFAIDMLCRRVEWRAEPSDNEDEEAKEYAEFVRGCMDDMSHTWQDTISEILSMLVYGWSYHEIVYKQRRGFNPNGRFNSKYDDGRIGWRKIPIRSQDTLYRWEFDESGGVRGMVQFAPFAIGQPVTHPVFIPIERSLLFRTRADKNNPEGRSSLRNAYRPWFFKKRIEEIEGIGVERDLAGLPVAYAPTELFDPNASADKRAVMTVLKQLVTNVRRDQQEGIVFPRAYDASGKELYGFELLSSGGTRQIDTDRIIARYDQRIAMTVIADFIVLGHENVGSFALGVSKAEMFTNALQSWVDMISEVFNRHAIPRLLEANGMDVEKAPRLVVEEVTKVDLGQLAELITSLAGAGLVLFPDVDLENYIRKAAGLPVRVGEDELEDVREEEKQQREERVEHEINPPQPPFGGPGGNDPRGNGSGMAAGRGGPGRASEPNQPPRQRVTKYGDNDTGEGQLAGTTTVVKQSIDIPDVPQPDGMCPYCGRQNPPGTRRCRRCKKVIAQVLDLRKHDPGGHNQDTHGNRYGDLDPRDAFGYLPSARGYAGTLEENTALAGKTGVQIPLPQAGRYVGKTELRKVQDYAVQKMARAKKPTKADITRHRLQAQMHGRHGGDARGAAADRRRSQQRLANEFGDGEKAPCVHCGLVMLTPEITRDRLYPGSQGGSYKFENLVPSCPADNQNRGDAPLSKYWKRVEKHAQHNQETHGNWADIKEIVDDGRTETWVLRKLIIQRFNQEPPEDREDMARFLVEQGWTLDDIYEARS